MGTVSGSPALVTGGPVLTALHPMLAGALHPRLAVAAGVDADLLPGGAPEELVDRQARDLAEDVPQGDVDGAQGGA